MTCAEGCPPEPDGCPHYVYPNEDRDDCGCEEDVVHDAWWRDLCDDCRAHLCGLT